MNHKLVKNLSCLLYKTSYQSWIQSVFSSITICNCNYNFYSPAVEMSRIWQVNNTSFLKVCLSEKQHIQ